MDPLIKLAVDIKNSEAVKKLTRDLEGQKKAVEMLNAQFASGAIKQKDYLDTMSKLATRAQKTTMELKSLETASAGAGRGLLQVAYAVDDLQYGFRSIVNNIPQIALGIGGKHAAAIAGAAGIAAVGISLLIDHWGQLMTLMQSAWSGTPVAELEKLRLKAEEAKEAFEKLTKTQTKAQTELQAQTKEAIVEGPAGHVFGDMVGKLMAHPSTALTPQELEQAKMLNPGRTAAETAAGKGTSADRLRGIEMQMRMKKATAAAARIFGGGARPGFEERLLDPARNKLMQEEYMKKQEDKEFSAYQEPREKQQRENEREARKNIVKYENAERERNMRDQEAHMHRMQQEQDARVKEAATRMLQSPLGRMMIAVNDPVRGNRMIRDQMRATGQNRALSPEVRDEMIRMTREEENKRMAETGKSRERVRQEMLLENVQRQNPEFGKRQRSEIVGVTEFARHLQLGIMDPHLTAQQETNRLLELLVGQGKVAKDVMIAVGPP